MNIRNIHQERGKEEKRESVNLLDDYRNGVVVMIWVSKLPIYKNQMKPKKIVFVLSV